MAADRAVRRELPVWGRVHIDRQLPFLCVYRRPFDREDAGTDRLVVGEAAYLRASARWEGIADLVAALARGAEPAFGAYLVVEVWSGPEARAGARPAFVVHASRPDGPAASALVSQLASQPIAGRAPRVRALASESVAPPGMQPLHSEVLGLEVRPIHRDANGRVLPAVMRALHRAVARAMKQACFVFATEQTTHSPPQWHAMGGRAVTRAVWTADEHLAAIASELDFMLMVTPVNVEAAWREFRRAGHASPPDFRYRAWPGDPAQLLRRLYDVPVHRIEDPTLRDVFEEKRIQLGRKVAMLRDRGTADFLYGSLSVFGGVDAGLLATARELLERIPPRPARRDPGRLRPEEFAELARSEIAAYRAVDPGFAAKVRLRDDVPGVMVSHGNLLVGADAVVPRRRVAALLQHEIGTHLVCHYNAKRQPFRLLKHGLPGYEGLQEGLALVAEYLAGGLDPPRLRLLAGRVVAVRHVIEGLPFVELFAELRAAHGFGARTAFMLAMRTCRGGGFTKDTCYLRGLRRVVDLLASGADLERLFVGKVSVDSLPIIEELLGRGVLSAAAIRPRFLEDAGAARRLQQLAVGMDLRDLCEEAS